jgi:hypothetical protein
MNIRDDDQVSAVALIVESEAETAARVADEASIDGVSPAAALDGDDFVDVGTEDAEADADASEDAEADADASEDIEPDDTEGGPQA